MNTDYIIVQAGGKGTRMEHLTVNKPKALVPINNLPMLFHMFRKYPDKRFIIIGDYKYEVLKKYLPDNIKYFDDTTVTSSSPSFIISEFISFLYTFKR